MRTKQITLAFFSVCSFMFTLASFGLLLCAIQAPLSTVQASTLDAPMLRVFVCFGVLTTSILLFNLFNTTKS